MHRAISLLTGTIVACLTLPTAAIAQICASPGQTANGMIPFGKTTQGNWLELNPRSVYSIENGMKFTYYLSGRRVLGFTTCREWVWYVRGEQVPAESLAARSMLNYICNSRISIR